ncbi:MAG: carboxypeptidase regulatory-like domain-containing protein [Rubricoccaceae bacterium]|nr:carboxypeptidase regulatory-like domain-containing protein [Rubricoccaceae bacterium]
MSSAPSRLRWGLVVLAALAAPAASAQVTTAGLRGFVTDDAGQPLPGATVVATHVPSGTDYGAATSNAGGYTIPNMRVGGPYAVRVTFVGYEPFSRDDILLTLGEFYQLDVELAEDLAELSEVEVIAAGGVFDPNRTGVNTSLSEDQIEAIPSLGRDLADFTRLTPQAYVENDDDDGPAVSIAGQSNRYNSIYIDGAVSNDVFGLSAQGTNGGQTGSTPISIDAVEQFQIAVSPFDVTQSGFTGGAINAVTRSGTNTFEGSLYGFFRNESLAGKTPDGLLALEQEIDPGAVAERLPEFSNNRYGFRVGGPILQDELFFFVNAEFLRAETPLPFGGVYEGDTSLDGIRELRQTLIDEVGYDPGQFGDVASSLDDDKVLVKLDWNASPRHRLSTRYSYSGADNVDQFPSEIDAISFSNNAEVFPNRTHSFTAELNSTLGEDMANKLIVGYTSVSDDRGFAGDPFPDVSIDDGDGEIFLGSEPFSTANILEQDILTLTNNFNLFRGDHTLTFGVGAEFYSIANLFIAQNFGDYEYNSVADFLQSVCAAGDGSSTYCQQNYNGEGPAAPDRFQRNYSLVDNVAGDASDAIAPFDAFQVGVYAQDEYRVNPQLRLTLGLRADVPKITTNPAFAPDAPQTLQEAAQFYDLQGAQAGETPAAAVYLSPRFGFNYDVNNDRTLQLRGGAGIFTGRVPFVWPGGMFNNNGTNVGRVSTGGTLPDGDDDPDNNPPIPFIPDPQNQLTGADFGQADIPSGSLEIFAEDFRYPRVFRTSLGVDAQLPGGFVGTLEGQYTKTIDNIIVTNVNLDPRGLTMTDGVEQRVIYDPALPNVLDPRYSSVHLVSSTSEGYAYDVTARLQKQLDDVFGDGDQLLFNLSYTFGDAFAVNDGASSQINTLWRTVEIGAQGPNEQGNVLSRSDFSIGHRVLGSATFRKAFLDNLATTVSLFYVGESGRPFNYVIDNFGRLVNATDYRDYGLVYVPEDIDEMVFVSAEDAQRYETYIQSSEYLSSRRGQFAERNGSRLPWENIVDLKFEQELFANLGGGARSLSLTFDIFNFTNLLNSDWGRRYAKFTSSSTGGLELLEFQGFCGALGKGAPAGCAGAGDLTPVYDYNASVDTEEEFFDRQITSGGGSYGSRWLMQLGVRLTF